MGVIAFMVLLAGVQGGLALAADKRGDRFTAGFAFSACLFSLALATIKAANLATTLPVR